MEKEKIPAVEVVTEGQKRLLYRKIERVVPGTYRCGVPIKRRRRSNGKEESG